MTDPLASQRRPASACPSGLPPARQLTLAQYASAVRLAASFARTRNPLKRAWLSWRAGILLLRTKPMPPRYHPTPVWIFLVVFPFVAAAGMALLVLGALAFVQGPPAAILATVVVGPNVPIGLRGASFLRRLLENGIPQELTPQLSSGPGQEKRRGVGP